MQMSNSSTSSDRLTHLLLAALTLGVWGLLLRPDMPLFSEAQAPFQQNLATLPIALVDSRDALEAHHHPTGAKTPSSNRRQENNFALQSEC
jgi:hypothetical protein